MKRVFLVLSALVICAPFSVFAEQLTTIAVVDLNKVTNTFYAQSQAVRDLQKKADDIRSELQKQQNAIEQLKSQKLQADQIGDQSTSLRLENEINQKQQFLDEYRRIKQNELDRQRKALLQSNSDFYKQMYTAIRFVAESLGYTMVIDTNDSSLLWWSNSVDITQQVIDRLRTTNNQ